MTAAEISTGVDVGNTNSYNKINALTYEIIQFVLIFQPKLILNPWIKRTLEWCRVDWIDFRAEVTMRQVDDQIDELHSIWEAEEAEDFDPVFLENFSDGSMRLTSSFVYKNEPSSSHEHS